MAHDDPLIERLLGTNFERALLSTGDRVLVAVSGGPDSLALLHALHTLEGELGIELVAAHLDHLMRGSEGAADADFVRKTAQEWGVSAEIGRRDVPALARRAGLSLEEAGRAARYRFFGRAARRSGCGIIATGHTADDRAETVLLHLFRGTGLDGLAGFPAHRPLRPGSPTPTVVRPLIDVSRAEVIAYSTARGLQPRRDATNESSEFLRNRVRRELLPLLETEYSPALRRHLLHLARLAEEEVVLLDAQARALLEAALVRDEKSLNTETRRSGERREGEGRRGRKQLSASAERSTLSCLRLARAPLVEAPRALARRALRLQVLALQKGPPPDLATVERLLSLAAGDCPGFTLPGGKIEAQTTAGELVLKLIDPVLPFDWRESIPLAIPGATVIPWDGSRIVAEELGVGCWAFGPTKAGPFLTSPARTPNTQHLTPNHALLDRARLNGPFTVRPPRPGDRLQPLGMAGHRKLQDLLTDHKVPRASRRHVAVVADQEKIVWVAGHCTSDAVKVTARTTEVVLLVHESG